MHSFSEILQIASARKVGKAAVLGNVPPVRSADEFAAITVDRWLAQMSRGVFQAGISWSVVKA